MASHRNLNLPSTSAVSGAPGNGQPRSFERYSWPTNGQQPDHTGFSNPDALVVGRGMIPRVPAATGVPSDAPRKDEQSGPPTDVSHGNVHSSYRASSGPTRTKKAPTRPFEPYKSSHARPTEHRNADAGPSSLSTPQPTGRLTPETTADTEPNKKATEGNDAPGRKVYKHTRKLEERSAFQELRHFVMDWKKPDKTPSRSDALFEAYKHILTVRCAVYRDPCLKKGRPGRKSPVPDEKATKLREERNRENRLLEQLSRCYPLEEVWGKKSQAVWSRLSLLNEVLKDLEVRYPPK